jgi:FdhD protein
MTRRVRPAAITRVGGAAAGTDQDLVVVEAPLEVVLIPDAAPSADPVSSRSLGVLMRTPGDDAELVVGALYAEGLIRAQSDVIAIDVHIAGDHDEQPDQARVRLSTAVDLETISGRTLTATSACGLCGRAAMLALDRGRSLPADAPRLGADLISALPDRLRAGQSIFDETGGLHAAGLFNVDGTLWLLREDVGRHNAVDKVVGAAFSAGRLPATDSVLVVSGRVAYEIVQKAAAAGVVAVVAVGAPSSLAVDAARATNLTLIGFARDGKFNVYAGAGRVS